MSAKRNDQESLSGHLEGFFDPHDHRHDTPKSDGHQDQTANENYQDQVWTEVSSTSKPWFKSKTMLFNIGVTAVGIGSAVLPFTQPFIKPRTFSLLTTAIGVANMALRGVTRDEVNGND